MKHTPGPWTISKTATPEWCKQYLVYADANPSGNLALVYTCEESEANARLISAAPDLLEAVELLLAQYGSPAGWPLDPETNKAEINARAAIRKATGG